MPCFRPASRLVVAGLVAFSLTAPALAGKPVKDGGGTTEPAPPKPNVSFAVTWLEMPVAVAHDAEARDINQWGDVVGFYSTSASGSYEEYGWIYLPELGGVVLAQDLALPPLDGSTVEISGCNGINNQREVVGWCVHNGQKWAGYRLKLAFDEYGPVPQPIEVLPRPENATSYGAHKINEFGDITVYWQPVGDTTQSGASLLSGSAAMGYTWKHIPVIRTGGGGLYLNNYGQVVSSHIESDGRTYGFSYDALSANVTTVPGFVSPSERDNPISEVRAINDNGVIAGRALYSTTVIKGQAVKSYEAYHAFLGTIASDGNMSSMTDLGVLGSEPSSYAYAVNSAGHATGYSGADGFLWTPENKIHNLDTLVLSDAGWTGAAQIMPKRMNDPPSAGRFGQIAGQAQVQISDGTYRTRAFLLTPTP